MKTRSSSAPKTIQISVDEFEAFARELDTGSAVAKMRRAAGTEWKEAATRRATRSSTAADRSVRPRPTGQRAVALGRTLDIVAPMTLTAPGLLLSRSVPIAEPATANVESDRQAMSEFAMLFPHRV